MKTTPSGLRAGAAVVAILSALVAVGCGDDVQQPESIVHRRPNLVVVVLDDLDETTTPYWDAMPRTKELIADRGMTFANAFATDPACCPARATLLTGMYPHNTGVYESTAGLAAFRADASKRSIAVRLRGAGYTTAFIGKYLDGYELDPSYVPPGWNEWFGLAGRRMLTGYDYQANHNGEIERFGDDEDDYQTDVLARTAESFVDSMVTNDDHPPFLLTLVPSAPHAPLEAAPRHADNEFTDDALPRRDNFDEAAVGDKPLWLRGAFRRLSAADERALTSEYRNRLGSLLAVDEMVGTVADRLDSAGELDDTVFVFTSDNGYSLGSHRIPGKLVPYEESVRVPMAVAGPGIDHADNDELVTHLDLAPTLYEIAGLPVPDDVDGRSILPLLEGRSSAWREDFLVEYRAAPDLALHTFDDVFGHVVAEGRKRRLVPDYRGLRNDEWLYVEWYSGDEHELELYDMAEDPYQLVNLLAEPATAQPYGELVIRLQARLGELAACSGAACR